MKKFRILATSDIHGSILSHNYLNNQEIKQSLSRISTAIKSYQHDELISIDNGDILQGSPLVTYNNRYQDFSVYAKALNALNFNYFNLGNHDFNYGVDVLNRYLNENQAHCLTRNIAINHQPIGSSTIYTTQEGHTIGLVGCVTDYIPHWEQPKNLENITIHAVKETIQQEVNVLRNKVDTLVVVYHGGFEKDLTTGENTEEQTGENIAYELTTIAGIDILITGHQHRSLCQKVNGVLCLQCSLNAKEFMLMEYDGSWSGQLVSTDQFDIDRDFEALFQEEEALTQQWLDTTIGSGPDMQISNVFEAQLKKPLFTTFVNQVAIEYFQADFSFSCLFNTSCGLQETITMRELIASYPYPNTFVLIEIDHNTLLEYLEKVATYFVLVDGKPQINPEFITPKLSMYDYDMGSGLTYQIDLTQPFGQRVTLLDCPEKDKYTMVVNNYRAAGGGSFFMIQRCKKIKEEPMEVIDLLYDYIQNHSPLKIHPQNNIVIKTK